MLQFDLKKKYRDFDLHVSGEVGAEWLVLLAASGGGKSLTLNMMAGFVRPDEGRVRLGERVLFDKAKGIRQPIRTRKMGYVFQNYALFPHMTVAENVGYGLPAGIDSGAISRWLTFFQMEGREAAYPGQLSGGQQQRVALARTLAAEPEALLLDEPLSALDRPTRTLLQRELAALKEELSIPVVLVTHDFQEAQTLGDQVMVLEQGKVLEAGDKQQLFGRPQRHQTASFLGVENILPARVVAKNIKGKESPSLTVEVKGKVFEVDSPPPPNLGENCFLCVRASDLRLAVDEGPRPNWLTGTVQSIVHERGVNQLQIAVKELDGQVMGMQLDDYVFTRNGLHVGKEIGCWLPPAKLFLCL